MYFGWRARLGVELQVWGFRALGVSWVWGLGFVVQGSGRFRDQWPRVEVADLRAVELQCEALTVEGGRNAAVFASAWVWDYLRVRLLLWSRGWVLRGLRWV